MRRIDEKYLITKRIERYQGPIYVQTEVTPKSWTG